MSVFNQADQNRHVLTIGWLLKKESMFIQRCKSQVSIIFLHPGYLLLAIVSKTFVGYGVPIGACTSSFYYGKSTQIKHHFGIPSNH